MRYMACRQTHNLSAEGYKLSSALAAKTRTLRLSRWSNEIDGPKRGFLIDRLVVSTMAWN